MFDWLSQHKLLMAAVAAFSTALLLIGIIATPWLVAKLPVDYLLRRDPKPARHPVIHLTLVVLGSFLGGTLILLGIVMLVTPGPGVVTVLLGFSLCSFPGKSKLLRFMATRNSIFASLNWMRHRHDKAPLIHPDQDRR